MQDKIKTIFVEVETDGGNGQSMYLDAGIADFLNSACDNPIRALLELQKILSTAMLATLEDSVRVAQAAGSRAAANKDATSTHTLKTLNPHFAELWEGRKTFEVRLNDRDFKVGDELVLEQWWPSPSMPVGSSLQPGNRYIIAEVLHILEHKDFPQGLKEGYCCMSIKVLHKGKV